MKAYRKRFVQFNMLLIGIVLTVMVTAVAVYMVRDYYTGLRRTMEQVVAPLGAFSQPPERKPGESEKRADHFKDKRGGEMNIAVCFYDSGTGAYTVLSGSELFQQELPELLEAVVNRQEDFGLLPQQHVIYYRSGSQPCKIALADMRYITYSMLKLCGALLGIWAGAMLLFFAISKKLAVIAARPMEEAMEREKQFVADASHDLKTPLSVILANNSILMENPQTPVGELGRWLDSTQESAKRMQRLIAEMLTLADVERQDARLSMEETDLAAIALKAELEVESLAYENGVTLETELPEQCIMLGNEDYLFRIVMSLLENALKYEPRGGTVRLRLAKDKRKKELSVQNLGSLISQEDLPHVFDRFYRGDKSRSGSQGGFGLGLAITREMTERLGGTLSVISRQGEGTTFTVTFGK